MINKITVLSVTYNQLDKLKILYKSLVDQKKYVKEWILYDDVSVDGTREWMVKLKAPFKTKFIYGRKRKKPLVVANMNECFKAMGKGPFILIFGDSYLRKDALKNLTETYVPNSFGSSYKINVTPKGKFISNHYLFESDEVRNMMVYSKPWEGFSGNGMIATKKIMESINYIDEEYGGYGIDDYDTAMRAMMNGALLYIYANVKLYHIDHPVKESTEDNKKRYISKLLGEGYTLK